MRKIVLLLFTVLTCSGAHPNPTATSAPSLSHDTENDGEKSRKIIGQSVVTSVSVITNDNEEKPYFTDAVGKTVPRPFVPPQVASPINLLNPDRYEFYTFNNKGELVKRLMTLREIQSIVANGNGAMISDSNNEPQSVMLNSIPLTNYDLSDTKVQDIVDNVQNVLSREMENNKNFSSIPQDLLDTPNVSASWSMILPAIFGNTGDEILPHKPINMIPETEIIDTTTTKRIETTKAPLRTTKKPVTKKPVKITTATPLKTTTKLAQRVTQSTSKKPATKRTTSKPRPTPFRSTSRRPSPVVIVNELFPVDGSDETTKTILITSRPFTSTTPKTTPYYQTTKLIPKTTTTRRTTTTVKKTTTLPPVRKNVTINDDKLHHLTPSSSALVKDTYITKIETKPLAESNLQAAIENESKIEKVTQVAPKSTTVLSTVSKIHLTSSPSTLPPTSYFPAERITTMMMKKKPTTMEPSTSVSMTTRHPITITTEGSLKTSTTVLSPIKMETTTERKNPIVEEEAAMSVEEEEETTLASSEEIRQDLAISQIIGSLNANHFYKPPQQQHIEEEEKEETTTVTSSVEEEYNEETTMISAMDKSGNDINLIPDKIFLDNQLYIDEKEPIVKEIPTTTPMMFDDYTTTEPSEPIYEKLSSTTIMTQSKEDEISLENSEVMQTIEKLLQEQVNSKNKIHLQKLNVVSFDDDDETEIKLKDTLNSKEKLTQSEYITKAATIASILKNKEPTVTPITTTPIPFDDQPDTTVSTILSEALSNVIEQMIREQENRKTTLLASTTVPPSTTLPTTPTITTTTTVKVSEESDLNEPSLDELNKLLYHYQELQLGSQRNELESLSLLNEKSIPITTTMASLVAAENLETTELKDEKLFEETSPTIIMQKSKVSNVQSIEFTTQQSEEQLDEESTFSTTEEPQEFSTFFYVSDNDVSTESQELGAFTTEQFVVTEKRISNRKDEEITTTMLPKKQSDEDEEEEEDDDDEPADYLTKVLNAINSIGSGDVSEEDTTSTEKSNNVSEEESDEIEHAISRISSTLDKTLKTDINADFGFTKKIASSLVSVADTISETLTGSDGGGGGDNESEENTDSTITRINTVTPQVHAKSSTQKEVAAATTERQREEEEKTENVLITTTEEDSQAPTTEIINEETTITALREEEDNKEEVEKVGGPMIQLSIIRKEDSLEKINLMSHNAKKASDDDEGNYIKIESIQKLSGFRNKTAENMKPTFIMQRSTTTDSGALAGIEQRNDENVEPKTERVPLIEKAIIKESSTASIPLTTEDNLVQIKVQTKPTVIMLPSTTTENLSQSTTISNAQIIKNSIKNSQQHQQLQQSRPAAPVELSTAPKEALGLAASTANLNSDLSDFSKLCNELAFTFWKSITADGISQSRSVVISPFALTSTLSMIFMGARGQTSGEMNDLLRLDDTVSFNPHVVFRNISESIEQSRSSGIAAAAFARELYSDRSKGKLLPYFKEKAQQFYGAHIEEVNFNVVNDILRRRTNLLVKKHTYNKIKEYLKTNNIWINEPLAAVSANVFMTDCSGTTNNERDGEMFFQVSPAIRQRRLVPIPAAVYRTGFTAGYDPILDATAVAFGDDLQSTILVMPGQQGSLIPGDNLERLENAFLDSSSNDAWGRLLTTFMERPGLEVQIPRFSHRSLINTTYALQQMGLKDIFDGNKADLRGLTGSATSDLYFSDLLQINQFTTCGEDKISDSHHVEIYPSPALKREFVDDEQQARFEMASVDTSMQHKSQFYDPIYDSRYMNVPLPLRPRQARLPENPRLRFDRPFLYFVRHNPTGIILFMGRFNPRLLP